MKEYVINSWHGYYSDRISKEASPELDEDWILNGINASEKFFKYRKNCRVMHESGPTGSINNLDSML